MPGDTYYIDTPINCTADPYETVTFLVGGHVDSEGTWKWSTGGEVGEADTCPGDHYTGACLGITWNQQLGCRSGGGIFIMFIMVLSWCYLRRFSLTDTECNLKERFICEREPK